MQQLEQELDWSTSGQQQNNFFRPLSRFVNEYAPGVIVPSNPTDPYNRSFAHQVADKVKPHYDKHAAHPYDKHAVHAPPRHADQYHHYGTPITEYTTLHHAPDKLEHFGGHPVHQDYTVLDEPGYDRRAEKLERKEEKRQAKEQQREEKQERKAEAQEAKRQRKAEKHALKYGDISGFGADVHSFSEAYPDFTHDFVHQDVYHSVPIPHQRYPHGLL